MCMCRVCKREADNIFEYVSSAMDSGVGVEDYVKCFESTYNELDDSFVCTDCYVKKDLRSRGIIR